jgi:hypothetical protein
MNLQPIFLIADKFWLQAPEIDGGARANRQPGDFDRPIYFKLITYADARAEDGTPRLPSAARKMGAGNSKRAAEA